jgi:hypothetical protein
MSTEMVLEDGGRNDRRMGVSVLDLRDLRRREGLELIIEYTVESPHYRYRTSGMSPRVSRFQSK